MMKKKSVKAASEAALVAAAAAAEEIAAPVAVTSIKTVVHEDEDEEETAEGEEVEVKAVSAAVAAKRRASAAESLKYEDTFDMNNLNIKLEELKGEVYALRSENLHLQQDVSSLVIAVAQMSNMFLHKFPEAVYGSSPVPPIRPAAASMKGFLWKLNDSTADMRWTKNYFSLEDGALTYYQTITYYNKAMKSPEKGRRSSVAGGGTAGGVSMELSGGTVVPSRIAAKGKFGFLVVPSPSAGKSSDLQGRTWLLCADANDGGAGRMDWVKVLSKTASGPKINFTFTS